MLDEQVREALIKRLVRSGWITGAKVLKDDLKPNTLSYQINYTPEGKLKMNQLALLFHELGLIEGAHWGQEGGELEALLIISRDQLRYHDD
ncbi:MAG TPA: hypothetical protein VFE51_20070 [Verrucomicrobiae bacterium]|nr:hypothetical protein [Verrucomicrobiae bacterium]